MSSNPPMALLPSFLACNHLSSLSPVSAHRICSGERPHRSCGETGTMRGQKLRGLFRIEARVMEHRFLFPWGVFENCNAIPYSELLSLQDRQTHTAAFYFLAGSQCNKTLSCLSPSALRLFLAPPNIPPVEGMEVFWRHPNVTRWKSFSGSGLECNAKPSTSSAQDGTELNSLGLVPCWHSSSLSGPIRCHHVGSAAQFHAICKDFVHLP